MSGERISCINDSVEMTSCGLRFYVTRRRAKYINSQYLCFNQFLFGSCDGQHSHDKWFMYESIVCNEEDIQMWVLRTIKNYEHMWRCYIRFQTHPRNFHPLREGMHLIEDNMRRMRQLFNTGTEWPMILTRHPPEIHPIASISITYDNSIKGSTTMIDLPHDCLALILQSTLTDVKNNEMTTNLRAWLRVCRKFNVAADAIVAKFVESHRVPVSMGVYGSIGNFIECSLNAPTSISAPWLSRLTAHGSVTTGDVVYTFDRGIIKSIIGKNFLVERRRRWSDELILTFVDKTYIISEKHGFVEGVYDIPYDTVFAGERRILRVDDQHNITTIVVDKDGKVISKDFADEKFLNGAYHIFKVNGKVFVKIVKNAIKKVNITDIIVVHPLHSSIVTYCCDFSSAEVIHCSEVELVFDERSTL